MWLANSVGSSISMGRYYWPPTFQVVLNICPKELSHPRIRNSGGRGLPCVQFANKERDVRFGHSLQRPSRFWVVIPDYSNYSRQVD